MFSAVTAFDALFVGSGVNALTGAAMLSRGGWRVCVLERNDVLGGALRTSDSLTEPGFTHELMASWHPLFAGSAAYAELGDDLRRHGLEYLNTDAPTATLFPDGGASFLSTSMDANVAEFERHAAGDGAAWSRQFEQFMGSAEHSFGVLSAELWSLQGLSLARKAYSDFGRRGLLEFAGHSLVSARDWLGSTFASERAHGLLAPWVLHTGLGPEQAVAGFMTQVIACALQLGGMPVPKGGGVALVEALAGIVREGGGELRTDADVDRVLLSSGRAYGVRLAGGERVYASRAVIAGVTPTQLYGRLLAQEETPPEVWRSAQGFRYGRSGPRPRPSGSRARRWCTSRPASTASRAPSTRPSAGCCRPRPRSSPASPARSIRAAPRMAARSSGSSSRSCRASPRATRSERSTWATARGRRRSARPTPTASWRASARRSRTSAAPR
jgi:phytoene dehydrogenase-like protein